MLVVDVMVRGPFAQPSVAEASRMEDEVAQAVGDITKRDRAAEQTGKAARHAQRKQCGQAEQDRRGQEKRQRVVALWIDMMGIMATPVHRIRAMKYPAMEQVFDEAEGDQAERARRDLSKV